MKSRNHAGAVNVNVKLPKPILARLNKFIADKWGAEPRWRGMKPKAIRHALIQYLELRGVR